MKTKNITLQLILSLLFSLMAFTLDAQATDQKEFNVQPRMRVIIDNDFGGDPDGLFQLTHHVLSPSVEIRGIIGSHLYKEGFGGPGTSEYAVEKVNALLKVMNLESKYPIYKDGNLSLPNDSTAVDSEAVQAIINEALNSDSNLPLFVVCGGGLTNIASAYLLEPKIADKLTLIWIGGPEHSDLALPPPYFGEKEYNLGIDLHAARVIFNQSNVPLWQVPRNAYRQPIMSHAELRRKVRTQGELGQFLYDIIVDAFNLLMGYQLNTGETYIMGDNPLVLLTALQSSFEPDPSSSFYHIKQTPVIDERGHYEYSANGRSMRVYHDLDNRLLFGDFYAKLEEWVEGRSGRN